MSTSPRKIDPEAYEAALKWNRENIPSDAFGAMPEKLREAGFENLLLLNAEREGSKVWQAVQDELRLVKFTWDVFAYQDVYRLTFDGQFGPQTFRSILEQYGRHWMFRGKAVPVVNKSGAGVLLSFDEAGGLSLAPKTSGRVHPISFVGVHWGSYNARALHAYFKQPGRDVSSHFGVDRTGVYQYADFERVTWHGTVMNGYSVGGDTCQPVTVDRLEQARAQDCDVEIIDNPYWAGDRKVLSLDPRIAWNMRVALEEACEVVKVPFKWVEAPAPGTVWKVPELIARGETGIIPHCYWDRGKWDVGPWISTIKNARAPW